MEAYLANKVVAFVLIMARIGSALALIPLFGKRNLPARFKMAFIIIFSFVLSLGNSYTLNIASDNFLAIGAGVFSEVLNGLAMGFVVVAMLNSIYIAGHMIDLNMGFGMAKVVSPMSGDRIALSSNFYFLMISLLFVVTNTHHLMIRAFALSLKRTELGVMAVSRLHSVGIVEIMRETFVIGFRLAMPVILTVLIANIILGLLSKAMPGLNVFMVGMPFKIFIGLSTVMIALPITFKLIGNILIRMIDYLSQMINAM